MIRVMLIRHGRTAWNASGRIQGRTDVPLSAAGRVELAGRVLPRGCEGFDWYTSPLRRAVETARLLGAASPRVDERIVELDWGDWEGRTKAELRRDPSAAFAVNAQRGRGFRPPGGESACELEARLERWLARVAAAGRPVVAVTHKGVIQMALARATGWDLVSRPPWRLRWDRAHLFSLQRTDLRLRVEALNLVLDGADPEPVCAPGDGWSRLWRELDAWQRAGRQATLWWRDDDATTPCAALDRLLAMHADSGVAPSLAVIPARAEDSLASKLERHSRLAVLQHGYAHDDHARPGEKAIELGGGRRRDQAMADVMLGRERLGHVFGDAAVPVMVPPWNRIDASLLPALRDAGFRGLSTFAARPCAEPVPGLRQTNTHVDLVDWRGGRRFRGEARCLDDLVAHLEARRGGVADAREPTGLLTHHLAHDEGCWAFLGALLERTRDHPGARWLEPVEVWSGP